MGNETRQYEVLKYSDVKGLELTDDELALINKQSLRELTADEVFVFRISASNNQIDREIERFTDKALEQMAKLFVGKTVIMDHNWRASNQTARVYAGEISDMPGIKDGKQLVLRAYMLKNTGTETVIASIEGGILREVSIGVRVEKVFCSICGTNRREKFCGHSPGKDYDGQKCHFDLDGITDAYEVSFVAVPANPTAGTTKEYGGEDNPVEDTKSNAPDNSLRLRKAEKIISIIEMEDDTDE